MSDIGNSESLNMLPWMDVKNLELWLATPVKKCISKDATGKGDNFLSNLNRLLVKTMNGDVSLIVKCRIEKGTAGEALEESTIFKKEQEMYSKTLKKIEELLLTVLAGDFKPLSPKCYYSCKNFLVMEDLTSGGFKMENRQIGLNLDQCVSVMEGIARFHAASIKLHELEPDSFREYQINFFSEDSTQSAWDMFFKTLMKTFIEELETWPAEQWSYYVEKLRHLHPNYLKRMQENTRRRDADFNVLTHGDVWINNMLFKDNEVRFVDFQFTQYTSFAIDLHSLIITSAVMDVKINHREFLIQEYHKNLCKTMTALGCERKLPTLVELQEEMDRKAMYGMFCVVCASAIMTADANCGFDLGELMKGNTPGRGMYSDYYKDIMKWGLPLLNDMGVFDYE